MLFSKGMKTERKKRGMTQKELSKRSGVSQSTISAVEKGVRMPTEETMVMIAAGLGCTVGKLLGEEKWAPGTEQQKELMGLIRFLTPEELQRVLDFTSGIIAARK
ncbi:MAG: helix-turn-helix transcriptional regulator [Clostridia bacterium]|nr:helix-turn-helix transcriptional regulator [Clostridia bacterium]